MMKVVKIMKHFKFISKITSIILFSTFLGIMSVNAQEDYYTLEEILAVPDDVFWSEEYADPDVSFDVFFDYFYEYCTYSNENGQVVMNSSVHADLSEDEKYIPNITEKKIKRAVGTDVEYNLVTPIDFPNGLVYDYSCRFYFPSLNGEVCSKEKLMLLEKMSYSIMQFFNTNFSLSSNLPRATALAPESVIAGDVNIDKKVDLYDVIWIASDLADIFDFTEGQQAIGDVNEDGECNLYDAVEIAKGLM